jgi:hypothetical protein
LALHIGPVYMRFKRLLFLMPPIQVALTRQASVPSPLADNMKQSSGESVILVTLKVLIIFLVGDLMGYLFISHSKIAFAGGLILGVILQAFIPPRSGWKQFATMMAIALLIGMTRSFLS